MKKIFLALFLLSVVNSINAQTEILKDYGVWFLFTNKVTITDKFYVANVTQQRRVGFLKNTQSFLIAPSINYKLIKNVSVGTGYMYYKYYPAGVFHPSIQKDENRFFQHITVGSTSGKVKLSQRFMFEERVIELINTNETPNVIDGEKYVNRFRYRLEATFNMCKLKNNSYIIGKLSNEIRVRFSDGITEPDFDQNNFTALLGYKLLNNSTIWMGYGRHYFRKNATKFASNTVLHVNLSYDFDLTKKTTTPVSH